MKEFRSQLISIKILGLISNTIEIPILFYKRNLLYFNTLLFVLFFTSIGSICKAQEIKGAEVYDTTLKYVHSPKKASFYSAVVPGLGQIYNGKWYKAPVIYAGAAVIGYYIYFNNDYYVKYKTAYLKKSANDPMDPITDKDPDVERALRRANPDQLKNRMDYWRRNRDLLVLGMAALYLANILDATVDAYLFDYDVSQDLSMKIKPTLMNSPESINFGLSCSLRF